MSHYDIIIIGSGVVGAAAGLAIAQKTSLKIAILDAKPISPQWDSSVYDYRVSAISLASKRFLQNINVWDAIAEKRMNAYHEMHVWDALGQAQIHFDRKTLGESALGYIVEDSVMRASLLEKMSQCKTIQLIDSVALSALNRQQNKIELQTSDNKIFSSALLIGADGANSWVREQLNTEMKTWDYEQTAIVATVKTELSHQKTAWQRFLSTGPLAFLPLQDSHTSSIVWSSLHARADELMQMTDSEFCQALTSSFEKKLGEAVSVTKRYSFPLRMRHVKNYVEEGIALIGDAAHTIHPLAGQGVNMGLMDAAALTDVITTARQKKRVFSAFSTLRRYERSRKSDNLAMLAAVDVFRHLFLTENKAIQDCRTAGINLINRTDWLKNFFANYALGNRDDLPAIVVRP